MEPVTQSTSITGSVLIILFVSSVLIFILKGIKIVPQSQNWLVERIGKYNRTLEAGLHFIIPFFESIPESHKVSIQEIQLPTDRISSITKDNVTITIKLAILYRKVDVARTVYRIYDIKSAIEAVVVGTVRSIIGQTDLDGVQSNRQQVALTIEDQLQNVSAEWGIKLTRVEIVEVDVDPETKDAMQKQLNAERERRAVVTRAEGDKQAAQLKADADLYTAQKEAEAQRLRAEAEAYSVTVVSDAIARGGNSAVDFEIRKLQTNAVQEISKGNNSKIILLPTEVLSSLTNTISNIVNKIG